jgi:long-chain acyl-CoA synthetase
MGNVHSIDVIPHVVPTGELGNGEDESCVYRNIRVNMENGGRPISTFRSQPESKTLIEIMEVSSVKYANLPCTGERLILPDGSVGDYEWMSYSDFYRNCLCMGRGLLSLGLKRGDRIGIYSANCRYWQMVAFGAYSVGVVVVPVYDSLGPNASSYVIHHSEMKALFSSTFKYDSAVDLLRRTEHCVETLVVLSDFRPIRDTSNLGVAIKTCKELLEEGRNSEAKIDFVRPEEESIIMYTSGSTGTPKGAVLSAANIVAGAASLSSVGCSGTYKDVYLSFLPLAHIYAVAVETIAYAQGAAVGYARGTVKDLISDIVALKPTVMSAVPRILNKVVESMRLKIREQPEFMQRVINWAIATKVKAIKENRAPSLLLDSILFGKFREALGGRMRMIISGGAPILQDVFDFVIATITPNLIQGYGLTEVSCAAAVSEIPCTDASSVGMPAIGGQIKLRRVEGTDYNPRDPERPAGEMLIRGAAVFQGYFKQPELTQEVLCDGWFATGDVCEIGENGQLRIIDRVKHLVKLSQGEYLMMTQLNDYYNMADIASFVFVHADSHYDQPVAVVFPKAEKLMQWQDKGIKDLNKDSGVCQEVRESLERVWKERNMRGFEKITEFLIDTEEPTVENGMLTPSLKAQYAAFRRKYERPLVDLYNTHTSLRI